MFPLLKSKGKVSSFLQEIGLPLLLQDEILSHHPVIRNFLKEKVPLIYKNSIQVLAQEYQIMPYMISHYTCYMMIL